jgi:hypothetical protein
VESRQDKHRGEHASRTHTHDPPYERGRIHTRCTHHGATRLFSAAARRGVRRRSRRYHLPRLVPNLITPRAREQSALADRAHAPTHARGQATCVRSLPQHTGAPQIGGGEHLATRPARNASSSLGCPVGNRSTDDDGGNNESCCGDEVYSRVGYVNPFPVVRCVQIDYPGLCKAPIACGARRIIFSTGGQRMPFWGTNEIQPTADCSARASAVSLTPDAVPCSRLRRNARHRVMFLHGCSTPCRTCAPRWARNAVWKRTWRPQR